MRNHIVLSRMLITLAVPAGLAFVIYFLLFWGVLEPSSRYNVYILIRAISFFFYTLFFILSGIGIERKDLRVLNLNLFYFSAIFLWIFIELIVNLFLFGKNFLLQDNNYMVFVSFLVFGFLIYFSFKVKKEILKERENDLLSFENLENKGSGLIFFLALFSAIFYLVVRIGSFVLQILFLFYKTFSQ